MSIPNAREAAIRAAVARQTAAPDYSAVSPTLMNVIGEKIRMAASYGDNVCECVVYIPEETMPIIVDILAKPPNRYNATYTSESHHKHRLLIQFPDEMTHATP